VPRRKSKTTPSLFEPQSRELSSNFAVKLSMLKVDISLYFSKKTMWLYVQCFVTIDSCHTQTDNRHTTVLFFSRPHFDGWPHHKLLSPSECQWIASTRGLVWFAWVEIFQFSVDCVGWVTVPKVIYFIWIILNWPNTSSGAWRTNNIA